MTKSRRDGRKRAADWPNGPLTKSAKNSVKKYIMSSGESRDGYHLGGQHCSPLPRICALARPTCGGRWPPSGDGELRIGATARMMEAEHDMLFGNPSADQIFRDPKIR